MIYYDNGGSSGGNGGGMIIIIPGRLYRHNKGKEKVIECEC
jgi:hypothetical protein